MSDSGRKITGDLGMTNADIQITVFDDQKMSRKFMDMYV